MADFQPWSPPQQNTPLQTLSQVLGIKQAQQNLETGQYQQQSAQADAQGAQQKMQERQSVQQMMKSGVDDKGQSILGPDGAPDASKVIPALGRIAPLTGQDIAQSIIKTKTDNVGLQAASTNLDASQRKLLMGPIQAAGLDPTRKSSDVNADIDNLVTNHPEMANAANYAKSLTAHLDTVQDPQHKIQIANQIASRIQGGAPVETQGQPGSMDVGGSIQPGVVAPAVSGGGFTPAGAPVQKTIPPGMMMLPNGTLAPLGGQYGTGGGGGNASPPGAPRTAAQDAPPPNAPRAVQDAYQAATSQANEHVGSIRNADADYGTNSLIANQIRKLSSDTKTGPGTEKWHNVIGALGGPVGANNVADYQLLGAYLDRQAAGARSAMGLPNTNQGTTESKAIAGNTEYQQKALQDKNDLTQSLVEGLHQYREGLDRVAGFSGQASPQAVNQFRSAWASNFDPNVYKGELAYKRSKADGDAFIKSLSQEEAQSLSAKRKALQSLSQGQVTQ